MEKREFNLKKFKPIHNRILVERVRNHQGIIVLTDLEEFDQQAIVLAAGPKVKDERIKKGVRISVPGVAQKYPDWSRDEVSLITEGDVAGILEEVA